MPKIDHETEINRLLDYTATFEKKDEYANILCFLFELYELIKISNSPMDRFWEIASRYNFLELIKLDYPETLLLIEKHLITPLAKITSRSNVMKNLLNMEDRL